MRKALTRSNRLESSARSSKKVLPAAVLGTWPMLPVCCFRRSSNSSSMKVRLIPATANGYSHSERSPSDLLSSCWNRRG